MMEEFVNSDEDQIGEGSFHQYILYEAKESKAPARATPVAKEGVIELICHP